MREYHGSLSFDAGDKALVALIKESEEHEGMADVEEEVVKGIQTEDKSPTRIRKDIVGI